MKKVKVEELNKLASEFGKRGGNALVLKRGRKYMKKISKLGVEARKLKNK